MFNYFFNSFLATYRRAAAIPNRLKFKHKIKLIRKFAHLHFFNLANKLFYRTYICILSSKINNKQFLIRHTLRWMRSSQHRYNSIYYIISFTLLYFTLLYFTFLCISPPTASLLAPYFHYVLKNTTNIFWLDTLRWMRSSQHRNNNINCMIYFSMIYFSILYYPL